MTAMAIEKILKEIDEEIERARKIMVEMPQDRLDQIANDTAESFILAYEECKKIIRKYMKDNWIPVERGLPDNLVNPITRDAYVYPVTVDLGGVTDVRYYSFWKGHWYNQSPHTMDHLVIAWMPRPEPYQPEKKGEENNERNQ